MSTIAQRLLPLRRAHPDLRAICPNDRFDFSPRYTDGVCPLCGWHPEEVDTTPPLIARIDRFWIAVGALVVTSIVMGVLVVLAYGRA